MGTTANQRRLFFNLRKAKTKISALEDGDMHPDRLRVAEKEVVAMNRRLAGDASLNALIRDGSESGEWQDWLVDETPSQERVLLESEEFDNRRQVLGEALTALNRRE